MNNPNLSTSRSSNQGVAPSENREMNNINILSNPTENRNGTTLLGHKREHDHLTSQETDQNSPDVNNINSESESIPNRERVIPNDNFGSNNSIFLNSSGAPCFDIIVEECVEGDSSEKDYDQQDDSDSNVDL
jgi:hypothetical protein